MITHERRRRITLLALIIVGGFNAVSLIRHQAAAGDLLSVFLVGIGTLGLSAIVILDYFLVRDPDGGDPDGG